MRISWKAFWAAIAFGATSGFGILPNLYELPSWLTLTLAGCVAVTVAAGAAKVVKSGVFLRDLEDAETAQVARWIQAGVALHWAWVAAYSERPEMWPLWIAALGGMSALEVWVAKGFELIVAHHRRVRDDQQKSAVKQRDEERREVRVIAQTDKYLGLFTNALGNTDIGMEPLARYEFIAGGSGVCYWMRPPRPKKNEQVKRGGKKQRRVTVDTVQAAEALAIAMSDELGVPLESEWVRVVKEPQAGLYRVVFVTRDIHADIIPFVDDVAPTSIDTPCRVGFDRFGIERFLRVDQHGQSAGKTRQGKSSLTQIKMAHRTRCFGHGDRRDCIQIVAGDEKLYDLVGGWLEVYAGTGRKIPLRVVTGPKDTAELLAALLRVAKWRQNQPMSERGKWPTISVEIDEAHSVLTEPSARARYAGKSRHASELAAKVRKHGGSADIWLDFNGQRSTQDQLGDDGGDISTNTSYGAAFATGDKQDIGRVTGDFQVDQPKHKGQFWLADEQCKQGPELVKAMFIQETDAGRDKLHDGPTIADVSWSRRDMRVEFDEGSLAAGKGILLRLHDYATDELFDYLRTVAQDDEDEDGDEAPVKQVAGVKVPEGLEGRDESVQEGYDSAMAALRKFAPPPPLPAAEPAAEADDEEPVEERQADPVEPVLFAVAEPEPGEVLRTLAERITGALKALGGRASKSEIRVWLDDNGGAPGDQSLQNELNRMLKREALDRPERGVYRLQPVTTG